jgi:hypothetical protein
VNCHCNEIRVGDRRYHIFIGPESRGAIQAVVLNRRTLALERKETVDIPKFIGHADVTLAGLRNLNDLLADANANGNSLVFLTTNGYTVMSINNASFSHPLSSIADRIEDLGGTRRLFFDAIDPSLDAHRYSYTLIGYSRLGHAGGIETQGEKGGTGDGRAYLNPAPVSGTLVRDHQWNYEVADTESAALPVDVGTHVVDAVFQPPSRWPEQDPVITPDAATRAREAAAIKWIGERVVLLGGADPRAAYYTLPYKLGTWQAISKQVAGVAFESNQGFSQADLAWAQGELEREIQWLEAVHDHMDVLAEPFARSGLAGWAKLQEIATKVKELVVPADRTVPDQTVRYLRALASVIAGIGGLFPNPVVPTKGFVSLEVAVSAGQVAHSVDSMYDAFGDIAAVLGEAGQTAGESYEAKTDALGTALAERLEGIQSFLTNEVPNIIADDYQKLRLVGSCFLGDSSMCPNPISQWQITNVGLNEAAKAVKAAAEINFWGVLLSSKYVAFRLPPDNRISPGKHFISGDFYDLRCPFVGESGSYGIYPQPRFIAVDAGPRNPYDRYQIWALAYKSGAGTLFDGYKVHWPRGDLTARVFGTPDSSGDLNRGGLGVYPEAFILQYFHIEDFDHYPTIASTAGRWTNDNVTCTE